MVPAAELISTLPAVATSIVTPTLVALFIATPASPCNVKAPAEVVIFDAAAASKEIRPVASIVASSAAVRIMSPREASVASIVIAPFVAFISNRIASNCNSVAAVLPTVTVLTPPVPILIDPVTASSPIKMVPATELISTLPAVKASIVTPAVAALFITTPSSPSNVKAPALVVRFEAASASIVTAPEASIATLAPFIVTAVVASMSTSAAAFISTVPFVPSPADISISPLAVKIARSAVPCVVSNVKPVAPVKAAVVVASISMLVAASTSNPPAEAFI